MADNMNCFEIDNLSFAYGDKKVIDDFAQRKFIDHIHSEIIDHLHINIFAAFGLT